MRHSKYDDKIRTRPPIKRPDASLALRIGWAIVHAIKRIWWAPIIIALGMLFYYLLGCRIIALG